MPGGPFFNCYPGPFSNVRCTQEMMLAQIGSPLALENARNNLLDMEDDE